MMTLSLKILSILENKAPEEKIYLRGREELEGYPKREILDRAEGLVKEGYLRMIHQDSFIEMDGSLVNYFFEITDSGHEYLTKLQLRTG